MFAPTRFGVGLCYRPPQNPLSNRCRQVALNNAITNSRNLKYYFYVVIILPMRSSREGNRLWFLQHSVFVKKSLDIVFYK